MRRFLSFSPANPPSGVSFPFMLSSGGIPRSRLTHVFPEILCYAILSYVELPPPPTPIFEFVARHSGGVPGIRFFHAVDILSGPEAFPALPPCRRPMNDAAPCTLVLISSWCVWRCSQTQATITQPPAHALRSQPDLQFERNRHKPPLREFPLAESCEFPLSVVCFFFFARCALSTPPLPTDNTQTHTNRL